MSTISKLNVDAIIDKSITSDKLADDFMLLSDALENEEVTAAALTELNNTKADKTAIDEITQVLASKADGEVVTALQQDLDSKVDARELSNYLPLSGGTLTGNLWINGVLTIPGLESNNDYIESVRYVNGLWGTESGKSPEITHDLASIKNAIKFNWYNDDWIIGNIRAGSASSDGFGIGMEKTKSDGTTIYQKNIFRLSPDGEIYLNGTPLANKYLSLSGGKMTGAISGLTSLTSAGNITATEYGFRFSSTQYDGYIWNTEAGKGVAIGVIDNGSTNLANASLVIKGTNIYPGTSNKFSLGTDSYKFKDILADGRVVGGRFLTGSKYKADLESNTNSGLSIAAQISLNGSTAGDYGFPANNNASGVIAFRTHPGSGFNYMHYLGFSNDGEIYHTAQNAPFAGWRNLTNPFGSIRMPRTIDGAHSQAVIPSMLNEGIVNIFNYPLKSELLIERSQDGSTWVDVTEDEYENFRRGFTKGYNQGGSRYVAYDKTNGKVGDRLRITYNPSDRYCAMGYIDVYYTTSGATTTFTLEHNTKADINTWTKIHDSKSCTGWPGHNYYGLLGYNFGQSNVTTGAYAYRMTFEITAISSSSNNLGAINYIYGFTSQTPYSTRSDSYLRYDVTLQACRNTGHIIPSSTGYELGNQQFPFKTVITQNLAISLGSGHTPNYITSDTNRNMFIKVADVVPFVVDCADTNNPVVRSGSSMAGKVNLGASTNKWKNVYANNFYANNFYGRLYTPDGTSNHFVKGNGSISTQVSVTHDATSASPLHQAICVNAATGTDDIAKMPGIGFHNPGKSYATLKYTGTFEFMNETLTSYKNVKAAKFITTGGTASQVVLGDGTLKNVSELGSSSLTYATLANTNIINAGFNYNNTYSGLTIDTYTGFTVDTPDTVIVSTYPITFSGSIMKMEGIENLSGNFYIYCLSFMANQMVAVNGAAYN